MDTKEIKVWCESCQTWHDVSSWDELSQFENWGCSLDLESTPDEKTEK